MAYGYNYGGYQPGYPGGYMSPVPDQLAQLRQNQMQQAMQPMQTMGQPMQVQPQQQYNGGIIRVQGEVGAKAYLVAPGNTVELWDTENPVIYFKSADMSGMPSMRILDYKERTMDPPITAPAAQQQTQYVTVDEFKALEARLAALENKPCECADRRRAKKEKEEVENA